MKIVIHIGMPKTGSTAIQRSLASNRDLLQKNGILYPINPKPFSNQAKHLILLPMLCRGNTDQWKNLPGGDKKIREMYGEEFDFFDFWISDLKSQISSAQPHTLVLSEEGLFAALGKRKSNIHKNLEDFCLELANNITEVKIIGYLRNPADYYLSMCQEKIKRYSNIKGFGFANYVGKLKNIRQLYKSQHQMFAFEKKYFPQEDVVRHFTKNIISYELASPDMPNETLSAAAMRILEDYWTLTLSKEAGKATHQEMKSLLSIIRMAEKKLPLPKPILKEEVRSMLMNSMAADLTWLSEHYDINYLTPSSINNNCSYTATNSFKPKKVTDIINIEDDNPYLLLLEVLRQQNNSMIKNKSMQTIE
jgi:hypothetical protein